MPVDSKLADDLATGEEPLVLRKAAYAHAESDDMGDLQRLAQALGSPAWLMRLDTEEDYRGDVKSLRLAGVIRRLVRNPNEQAERLLAWLTTNRSFVASEPRQELLILALAMVRPPSADAIAFWRLHSSPGALYRHLTIDRLVFNGHDRALTLLGEQVLNERHEVDDRIVWIRADVIRCRYRRPLLEACQQMLAAPGAHDLRPLWLEVLSHYDEDWYLACDVPQPQTLEAVEAAELDMLRRLARDALSTVPLSASQSGFVQALLEDVDDRLQQKRA